MASYHQFHPENINREQLLQDEDFVNDARSFLQNREGYTDEGFFSIEDPDDLFDAYLEHFRVQNVNEVTAAKDLNYAWKLSKEENADELNAFGRLMQTYDNVDSEWGLKATQDYVGGILSSPTTYVGLASFGTGKAAGVAAKTGVQLTLKKVLKDSLAKQAIFKNVALSGAIEGGSALAITSMQEQARVESTDQEDINWKNVSLATALSTLPGAALSGGVTTRKILTDNAAQLITLKNRAVLDTVITKVHNEETIPLFNGTAKIKNAAKAAKNAKNIRKKLLLSYSETIPELLKEGKKIQKITDAGDTRPYALTLKEIDNISSAGARINGLIDDAVTELPDKGPLSLLKKELKVYPEGIERWGSKLATAISIGVVDKRTINPILKRHNIELSQLGPLLAEELSRAGTTLNVLGKEVKNSRKIYKRNFEALNALDDQLLAQGYSSMTKSARKKLKDDIDNPLHVLWSGIELASKASVGLMTIQLATTVRNTSNGYLRNFTYALDNYTQGQLNIAQGSKGKIFDQKRLITMGEVKEEDIPRLAKELVKRGQAQVRNGKTSALFKDMLFGMTSVETQALFKILQDPSFGQKDEVVKLIRGLGDLSNITGEEKGLLGAVRWANSLNTLSDNVFKRAIFSRELDMQINMRPIKLENGEVLDSLSSVMKAGEFNRVPSEYISESMTEAFEYTYQFAKFNEMEGGANKMASWLIKAGSNPVGALFTPFPRYLVNQFRFWYSHTPILGSLNAAGLLNKPQRKSAGKVVLNGETLAKQITGLATIGTFLGLRTVFGDESTDAFTFKNPVNNKTIDARALLGPYSMFAFVADIIYRSNLYGILTGREEKDFNPYNNLVRSNRDNPKQFKEFFEAAVGQLGRGGTGIYMIDQMIEAMQGAQTNDELYRAAAKFVGSIPNRALVGAGMLKDLAATTDTPITNKDDYTTLPDNADVDAMKIFLLQATRSLPMRFDIGGVKYDLTDHILGVDNPLREDLNNPLKANRKIYKNNPIVKQLTGVMEVDEDNAVTKELKRLRMDWRDYAPKKLKAGGVFNNIARKHMALIIQSRGLEDFINSDLYQDIESNEQKETELRTKLSDMKTYARKLAINFNQLRNPSTANEEVSMEEIERFQKYVNDTIVTKFLTLPAGKQRELNQKYKVDMAKRYKSFMFYSGNISRDLRGENMNIDARRFLLDRFPEIFGLE